MPNSNGVRFSKRCLRAWRRREHHRMQRAGNRSAIWACPSKTRSACATLRLRTKEGEPGARAKTKPSVNDLQILNLKNWRRTRTAFVAAALPFSQDGPPRSALSLANIRSCHESRRKEADDRCRVAVNRQGEAGTIYQYAVHVLRAESKHRPWESGQEITPCTGAKHISDWLVGLVIARHLHSNCSRVGSERPGPIRKGSGTVCRHRPQGASTLWRSGSRKPALGRARARCHSIRVADAKFGTTAEEADQLPAMWGSDCPTRAWAAARVLPGAGSMQIPSRRDTRIRVGAVSLPLWVRLMAQDAATRGDQTAAQRWMALAEAIAQRTVDSSGSGTGIAR